MGFTIKITERYINCAFAVVMLTLTYATAHAQSWSIPAKSGEMQMGSVVYIENIYQRQGVTKLADTLSGTGLLLSDGNRVYLVTAKHLIQKALMDKNQELATNNLFISTTWKAGDKGMWLTGLADETVNKRAYVFSADKEDLAIISLQKAKYKPFLAAILKSDQRPVPVDSIDKVNDRYPGEQFFHPFFIVFKGKTGAKQRQLGLSTGKVKTFDEQQPTFITEETTAASFSGSPIFIDNKIAGIFLEKESVTSNADIVSAPYHNAKAGVVIKASYLLPLLKKLQQNENMTGFN